MTTETTSRDARLAHSLAGSYLADELVVVLAHEKLVLAQLGQWDASPDLPAEDRDARLCLGRVRLHAAPAVVALRATHQQWVHDASAAARQEGYEPSDLDIVIRCLRFAFAQRFAGWVPAFGKNRIVSRAHGSYVIDGGGAGGGPRAMADYVVPLRDAAPGNGVRVGVVDTKVAQNPWLAGGYVASAAQILPEYASPSLPVTAEHGTFVTGLILRQAPGATVVVKEGLDDQASADSWSLARTIADLASSSTDVVNLSLGCLTDDNQPPLVLTAAMAALGPGTVAVAAAGNNGETTNGQCPRPEWPAALDTVITVGALDHGNRTAPFSPEAPWVDAVAPGVEVVSTTVPRRRGSALFAAWSGTSFAAAAVSGAIAARVVPGVDPHEAWRSLSEQAPRDQHGRPIVALGPLGADGRDRGVTNQP